jgi:hypothetical protein
VLRILVQQGLDAGAGCRPHTGGASRQGCCSNCSDDIAGLSSSFAPFFDEEFFIRVTGDFRSVVASVGFVIIRHVALEWLVLRF